jgi:ribonuclease Y
MDYLFSHLWVLCFVAFSVSSLLVVSLFWISNYIRKIGAENDAARLIAEAIENAAEIESEAKARAEQAHELAMKRVDHENEKVEDRLQRLEDSIRGQEQKLETRYEEKAEGLSEAQSRSDQRDAQVKNFEKKVENKKDQLRGTKQNLIDALVQKSGLDLAAITAEVKQRLQEDYRVEMARWKSTEEAFSLSSAELDAKNLLTLAINRFARPYCPERGIGFLNFDSKEQAVRVLGPEEVHMREVEKICGVEVKYDSENNAVNVYGFDPVRRELGHSIVEKLMNEKNVNLQRVNDIAIKTKKQLMDKIVQDGNRIANELQIDGLDKEIKNMMGALRYRYSFTQNQHFHCAEVGFLAGVLGSELNVNTKSARRAGLLHDIGKAMDHAMDGGHAMIGADFIQTNGESPEIVHAVRAHHFDEQPSTDLAFLVIAADAISGARPGARRSTATTYTQKIQDLQSITRKFPGVVDTLILNAGREARVYVDGDRLDDIAAMKLCKEIATTIETEMSYPGQIKVTVVRETFATDIAK